MESVSNMDSLRCSLTDRLSIDSRTIPTDNFGSGMFLEPFFHRRSLAVWQQIHWGARLEVNDNGAIRLSFTEGKIINTDLLGASLGAARLGGVLELIEHGIIADDESQELCDKESIAGSNLPQYLKQDIFQTRRLTLIASCNLGESLRKDAPFTIGVIAEELSQGEFKSDGVSLPG